MKWISVKDMPAPKESNIWAMDEYGGQANIYWQDDQWWFETFEVFKIGFDHPIAYWMELPKEPKD